MRPRRCSTWCRVRSLPSKIWWIALAASSPSIGTMPASPRRTRRLLSWQQAALTLASENTGLRGLLKLTPEPAATFITARVIANSGGAYVRSLMVHAGSENGVARGQAAMTGEGLVGRVAEVGSRAARVLLVTDLNSRVPVIVEGSQQQRRCWPATIPSARASAIWIASPGSRSVTGSSPRDRAASSRPGCRSASSRRSTARRRASSPMSSCRGSSICGSSITGWPTGCPSPYRSPHAAAGAPSRPSVIAGPALSTRWHPAQPPGNASTTRPPACCRSRPRCWRR